MESQTRTPSDPVNTLDAMHQQPWEYDFFQALRRIECESPELPRLGHSLRLADDPLRLGQQADCTFAPATLASVQPGIDGSPARLEQFFLASAAPTARCRCTSPNMCVNASATTPTAPANAFWMCSIIAC